MTFVLVGFGLVVSFVPAFVGPLEYDRHAVAQGQLWRLLTGQLVHWTPRMVLVDLGVLLALGCWMEHHSPRIWVGSVVAGATAVGVAVHLFAPDLATYRGSSGMATAAFAAVACTLACAGDRPWYVRTLGRLAIVLAGAKIAWEMWHGSPLAAGRLPADVRVTPLVHMVGALAGLGACSIGLLVGRVRAGKTIADEPR